MCANIIMPRSIASINRRTFRRAASAASSYHVRLILATFSTQQPESAAGRRRLRDGPGLSFFINSTPRKTDDVRLDSGAHVRVTAVDAHVICRPSLPEFLTVSLTLRSVTTASSQRKNHVIRRCATDKKVLESSVWYARVQRTSQPMIDFTSLPEVLNSSLRVARVKYLTTMDVFSVAQMNPRQ